MKKRYIASLGAAGAGVAAGLWLKNKRRNKNESTILEQAGIPDQLDNQDHTQLENAKMVSEGSQFGIHYYNEKMHEEENNVH